jgi:mitogen-activated protein kinase kinase kinase
MTWGNGSETGDESPSSENLFDGNAADQDISLYYGNDDMQPSLEELKIPANRERLEWHSMLASVLMGDVVKQEKKRLTGTAEQQGEGWLEAEIWLGVRAKCCGRTLAAQRRMVEDARAGLDPIIESIINFQIKGEKEAGKPPIQQVRDVVARIERCESLFRSRASLHADKPRAGSEAFRASSEAVIAWHSTTEQINTELGTLRRWVGNHELDFSRAGRAVATTTDSTDSQFTHHATQNPTALDLGDDSFLDRILKEDGLRSLQGEHSMLLGVSAVIRKAKAALIENAEAFAARHLPPYIEELLTLLNFPSRLIEEIIRMRLSYARRLRDPSQQNAMMVEQMISQFRILLRLAVQIKQEYTQLSQPEPGWELPPCIDEDFDRVVVEALKFYFQMLNWKLSGNKNTFKEAEILEQEWEFSNDVGRHFDGGDVEVAEQFR